MAQGLPGYVVTLAGDTLRGTVAEKRAEQLEFYADAAGPAQVFQASQLRGYGLQGQPLIASRLVKHADHSTTVHFVLPSSIGPASLYTLVEKAQLLLQPTASADTLYELTATNWHLLFNRHLTQCPAVSQSSQRVLDMPFSDTNVKQLIYQYNLCVQPAWKPTSTAKPANWQRGYTLKLAGFYVYEKGLGPYGEKFRGASGTLAMEWTAVRASGFLVGFQVEYGLVQVRSTPYKLAPSSEIEFREQEQTNMLSGTLALGHRFGRSDKAGFYLMGGLGPTALLHDRTETQERVTGAKDFQTSYSNSSNAFTWHFEARAGAYIPLPNGKQLQLGLVGRRFNGGDIRFIGIQTGYCWNRK
ncbi:hypothetical protein [Hymenobacter guriensis]|uniref:Uncharacterized protein n=1 Tax=Hymenobacter guriensis TaxID=2793065 RepID=A0ABS0KVX1_9BACT|nr:hypothetical protein [Hymenobacter guriensis]MBG8551973.1 hypothetical protein [Hymenobacter guriensis]